MGGEVLGPGGHNIGGLGGDHGAVGVRHEAGQAVVAHGPDHATGRGEGYLGGVHVGGVSRHHGAVGVGHEAVVGVGVGVSVGHGQHVSGEVRGAGGLHLQRVGGHHGAVGVGDQGLGGAQGDTGGENLTPAQWREIVITSAVLK